MQSIFNYKYDFLDKNFNNNFMVINIENYFLELLTT